MDKKYDPAVTIIVVGDPPVDVYICETEGYMREVLAVLDKGSRPFRLLSGANRETIPPHADLLQKEVEQLRQIKARAIAEFNHTTPQMGIEIFMSLGRALLYVIEGKTPVSPDTKTGTTVIPARLKQAREQAGLSLSQAAKLFHVDIIWLSQMETLPRLAKLTDNFLGLVAKAYGVSESWLCGHDAPLSPETEAALDQLAQKSPEDARSLETLLRSLEILENERIEEAYQEHLKELKEEAEWYADQNAMVDALETESNA